MKLQQLTIHNIASIEDAFIDFEAQPLSDSDVFLITGKTGAGKSTILDAICLALYANTPRLENTSMQGVSTDNDKEITTKDPRQIMRRDTGEAYVSLTFIGNNNIHYQATWSVTRARKQITGNLQGKQWELKNLNTGNTLTKDNEIKNEIFTAIGLDFNQFCRTTMLAQGEFTRFLNSKDDEKAAILEKITGVDTYSKIGAKIYKITQEKEQDWKNAKTQIDNITTLTDEEIQTKEETIKSLTIEAQKLEDTKKSNNTKIDWINKENELTQKEIEANEAYNKTKAIVEKDEFKHRENTVAEWNATIEARQWLSEKSEAEKTRNTQEQQLSTLKRQYLDVLKGLNFSNQELNNLQSDIVTTQKFIDAEKNKSAIYENAQTIIADLNSIASCNKSISENQITLKEKNDYLSTTLQPALEKVKTETEKAKNEYEEQEKILNEQEVILATLNLSNLYEQKNNTDKLIKNIDNAIEKIQFLAEQKKNQESTRSALNKRLSEIKEKQEESNKLDTPIGETKIKMDTHKEAYDKQKDSIDKFASTIRHKLHLGDTCPVCCQKIEAEIPLDEEISKLVSALKEELKEAEENYNALNQQKNKLEAEIKADTEAYNRDKKTFDNDQSVHNAETAVLNACKICNINTFDDTTLATLNSIKEESKNQLEILQTKISEAETQDKNVKTLRESTSKLNTTKENLIEQTNKAQNAVDKCNSEINTLNTLIKEKKEQINEAKNRISQSITTNDWSIDWQVSPYEFAQSLKTSADTYNDNIKILNDLQSKFETAKIENNTISTTINRIKETMPAWATLTTDTIEFKTNLFNFVTNISNSLTETTTQLNSAIATINDRTEKLNLFFTNKPHLNIDRLYELNQLSSDKIATETKSLHADHTNVATTLSLLNDAQNAHKVHQENKPTITEEDTLDNLTKNNKEINELLDKNNQKIGAINQELKTDRDNKENIGKLIKEAESKYTIYEKWAKLNNFIGDATGNKFRKIAQSYVLSNLIHSANIYMKTLTDRYTLKVKPGTFLISIEDAYQGFASRVANTISGGESFLVSLSLALALSDIAENLSVDTLFIDEGFGTLSGDALQNAINTLRNLHTKAGRHVGIISHVEELKEKIPVQIQVNQENNSSSSKIKIVPENN